MVFIAQNKGISKPGLLYLQDFILLAFKYRKADKMRLCTYTADDISTNMQLWNFSTVRQLKTVISDCDWWFMVLPVCSIFSTSINRYLTKYCQFVQHFVYDLLHYLEYGSEQVNIFRFKPKHHSHTSIYPILESYIALHCVFDRTNSQKVLIFRQKIVCMGSALLRAKEKR